MRRSLQQQFELLGKQAMVGTAQAGDVAAWPARARLVTKPCPSGSPTVNMTIGIVFVAYVSARIGGVPLPMIRSGWRATTSATTAGMRSARPS